MAPKPTKCKRTFNRPKISWSVWKKKHRSWSDSNLSPLSPQRTRYFQAKRGVQAKKFELITKQGSTKDESRSREEISPVNKVIYEKKCCTRLQNPSLLQM